MDSLDDAGIKAEFERQIIAIWRRKTLNCTLLNVAEYNAKLQRLVEIENPQVQKTPADYKLTKLYDYIIEENNGHPRRRLCKRGTSFFYVPIEEMYDILKNAHLHLRHAGRNSLQLYFRNRYCNITKDCIMTFLGLCKQCPRKKKIRENHRHRMKSNSVLDLKHFVDDAIHSHDAEAMDDDDADVDADMDIDDNLRHVFASAGQQQSIVDHGFGSSGSRNNVSLAGSSGQSFGSHHSSGTNLVGGPTSSNSAAPGGEPFSRAQVDIIDMTKNGRDGEFGYIFKYTSLQTMEIRLKPMRYGTVDETAELLIEVYCEQGAPVVLQSILLSKGFVQEVVDKVTALWPDCRQLYGERRFKPPMQDPLPNNEHVVLDRLSQMQKRLGTNYWVSLLKFVQWEMNSSFCPELGRSPIEAGRGRPPTLGLPGSKLLEAVYDKTKCEDQMLELLAEAETLRYNNFCFPSVGPSMSAVVPAYHSAPAPPPASSQNVPGVSASVSITSGHFLDESQLMPASNCKSTPSTADTPQPPASVYHQSLTASVSGGTPVGSDVVGVSSVPPAPQVDEPVYLDYQALHHAVDQEQQVQAIHQSPVPQPQQAPPPQYVQTQPQQQQVQQQPSVQQQPPPQYVQTQPQQQQEQPPSEAVYGQAGVLPPGGQQQGQIEAVYTSTGPPPQTIEHRQFDMTEIKILDLEHQGVGQMHDPGNGMPHMHETHPQQQQHLDPTGYSL